MATLLKLVHGEETPMTKCIVVVAALLVAIGRHAAADSNEARYIMGLGTTSCGFWTQARHDQRHSSAAQWVFGFLSGVNFTSDKPDALAAADFHGLIAWMDNYCTAHPLAVLSQAAVQLLAELRVRP
jgi:hypothetical protein